MVRCILRFWVSLEALEVRQALQIEILETVAMPQVANLSGSRWGRWSLVLGLGFCVSAATANGQDSAPQKVFRQAVEVQPARVRQQAESSQKPAESKPAQQAAPTTGGPAPHWIWGPDPNAKYVLRREFEGGAVRGELLATCDNVFTLYLNDKKIAEGSNWGNPVSVNLDRQIKPGTNVLEAEVANQGGPSGFLLRLAMGGRDRHFDQFVVSDDSWQVVENRGAKDGKPVKTLAKLGAKPWGDVFAAGSRVALPAVNRDEFNVLPGFKVEKLFTVPKEQLGSWVAITFDNKGRLIASDQGNLGLCRITPPAPGSNGETIVEKLDVNISAAQGLLYAFDSLYISVNGPGSGLYRARDTNGDDQFDEVTKLRSLDGAGEHGPHALRLSPDGKSIYMVCGNHTNPTEFSSTRLPANWGEDLLLPRQWDARGHARGRLAPGGWIAKVDPEGKNWELVSAGYRNSYSIDFNADGELFAYDSDMEWDMGSPWYRPTRVMHAVSGSEFGWRSGTGKWPSYYVDSLPEMLNIGPGSPVGVTFGYGAKFPAAYQKALFILDWTFGTIYALHLQPEGASYKAVKEEFVSRTPLPLTDAAIGPDGALYFTIGGRGTQSELFRVVYEGDASTAAVDAHNAEGAELRKLRQSLEAFHRPAEDPAKAIDLAWPNLSHSDQFIRYAARVVLEHQPVSLWAPRVLSEQNPTALITAAVALARQGDKDVQGKLLAALDKLEFPRLTENQQLDLLRAYSLTFIRQGEPDAATAARIAKRLDAYYPTSSDYVNRELCQLLVYLKSPTVVSKTLELMRQPHKPGDAEISELLARNPGYGGTIAQMLANQPNQQLIQYAFSLRNVQYGWTLEQRREYLELLDGQRSKSGGASFQGFIDNIRAEALANASEAERKALESLVPVTVKKEELPAPIGPGRDWTVTDLMQLANGGLKGRDFEAGRRAYAAARCVVCHRFGGDGGATGPDLTNTAGRFGIKDLGEAIVEPSKVISDQYRAHTIITASGMQVTGRVASDDGKKLVVLSNPEDITQVVEIAKDDVDEMVPSTISLMPKDLLKSLNRDEVLDLLAYLLSRGNPNDPMFAKP